MTARPIVSTSQVHIEAWGDYPTPIKMARQLVRLLPVPDGSRILEPHANKGNFIRAIRAEVPDARIWANELQARYMPHLTNRGLSGLRCGDFLEVNPGLRWDWIIGNPPFTGNEGIRHVEKALQLADNVAFLLPLRYLASKRRKKFWDRHPARHLWVIDERPVFVGTHGGRTDYAFFWWQNGYTGPKGWDIISLE